MQKPGNNHSTKPVAKPVPGAKAKPAVVVAPTPATQADKRGADIHAKHTPKQ